MIVGHRNPHRGWSYFRASLYGGRAPPRTDSRPSQLHRGFDGQTPRGSDIFGLGREYPGSRADWGYWDAPKTPEDPDPPRYDVPRRARASRPPQADQGVAARKKRYGKTEG